VVAKSFFTESIENYLINLKAPSKYLDKGQSIPAKKNRLNFKVNHHV
jgi:hypothetical protein